LKKLEEGTVKIDQNAGYSKEHEWVRKEGDGYAYGITDHAQDQLSDIVYVELPDPGESFTGGDVVGVVESVKAAADLYLPISGEITEVNENLLDNPEIINSDPYGEGWILKLIASNPSEFNGLLSAEDYEKQLGEE
jgi:glycine cleavage system H protein